MVQPYSFRPLVASLVSVFMVAALAAQEPSSQTPPTGAALLAEACTTCHDLRPIVTLQKSEEEWRHTVNVMIWRGAQILPEEVDLIASHLAQSSVSAEQATTLPPGEGRELVTSACLGCHPIGVVIAPRRTAEEWKTTIEKMIDLGSVLTEAQKQTVTDYLTTHFGVEQD